MLSFFLYKEKEWKRGKKNKGRPGPGPGFIRFNFFYFFVALYFRTVGFRAGKSVIQISSDQD
uniref:Uncharacterized protein n=1 Tax=Nelumbo nucifera TaxID=4432 RepID=A0A822Y7R1_NELNU|nr:TPA_asm: hypothetical protein HUJ06_028724 [Nelumbo nucifera]